MNDSNVISPEEQCDGDSSAGEGLSDDEVDYLLAVRRHPAGKRRGRRTTRAA